MAQNTVDLPPLTATDPLQSVLDIENLEDGFQELDIDKEPVNLQKEGRFSWKSAAPPNWEDITELVTKATEEMELGQLLHKENFTLNEGMSAVEIMDPKMDSGMGAENVHTLEEAIETKRLPHAQTLTIQQLIGIVDNLFILLSMWLDGYSLAHTLFTCLYLHRPVLTLENTRIYPLIAVLLKTVALIRAVIMKAEVAEEEDFHSYLFNFSLCDDVDETAVVESLKKLEEEFLRRYLQRDQSLAKGLPPLQSDATKESEFVKAFLARVRFFRSFHMIQKHLDKPACSGLAAAKESITLAKQQLEIICSTSHLGEIPSGVFEYEISRRLSLSTPPRSLKRATLSQASKKIEQILDHQMNLCVLDQLNDAALTLRDLDAIIDNINSSHCDILTRSRLLRMLVSPGFTVFGRVPLRDLIMRNGVEVFNVPKKYFENDATKRFLSQLTKSYFRLFQCNLLNRARQRRRLSHMIDEFFTRINDGVQLEDKLLEGSNNRPFIISTWLTDPLLRIMIRYLELGFELEIYETYEYFMIYWYLDNLYAQLLDNYQSMQKVLQGSRHSGPKRRNKKAERKAEKKAAMKKVKQYKDIDQPLPETSYLIELEMYHYLVRGILRMLAACHIERKFSIPTFPFGSTQSRFYRRFYPFFRLPHPQPFYFESFQQTALNLTQHKAVEVLAASIEAFNQCNVCIEKLLNNKETPSILSKYYKNNLKRVIVSNIVNAQLLLRDQKLKDPKTNIKIDFSLNTRFAVISPQG
jgi:hypothetical protein